MPRKKKCPDEGAPLWVMTYGDMMSLLLTFFILLAALSELKREDEYLEMVKEIKQAFGYSGGAGVNEPRPFDPKVTLIQVLEELERKQKEKATASTIEEGPEGAHPTVQRIREGKLFAVGGRITFPNGSAQLTDEARAKLDSVARTIAGYNNKVEVRGHASPMDLVSDSPYTDLYSLSFARAKAVMQYFTSEAIGLDPKRFRLIGSGDQEPVVLRVYTLNGQEPNRRVEIFVSETLVEELRQPESDP